MQIQQGILNWPLGLARGSMENYRYSSWLIRNEISATKEVWLHGYTGAVDIIEKRYIESPSEEILSQMLGKGYLVKETLEEEKLHFLDIVKEIDDTKSTANTYVVQFTIACNFACAYCSENSTRRIKGYKNKRITLEYFDNINKIVSNFSENTSEDKLILFGGEPLLVENYAEVERAIKLFNDQGMKELEVITNGYNVDHFIDLFDDTDAVFQITLDGRENTHDKRRIEKATKHSYKTIIKNIQSLLSRKHTIYLRINVDHKNREDIPHLFDEFISYGFDQNPSFKPYLGYTHDYGKYDNKSTTNDLYEYFVGFDSIEKFNISRDPFDLEKSLEHSINNDVPFEFKSAHCGANKGNMLMFAPDGKIHACWDSSPNDKEIGTYYPEIRWNTDSYQKEWLNRTISSLTVCQNCKYALFCAGGCQYMAKNETGNYYSPHCNGYQNVFNDVLVCIARELL